MITNTKLKDRFCRKDQKILEAAKHYKEDEEFMKQKLQEYYVYFMIYSIIGWIYEVFLEVVVYRWGFSNRGVLFGPYCVIYGTGALILLFSLGKFMEKRIYIGKILATPLLVFIGIIIITTVVELIGSYIMEAATGGWAWDYRRFAFNFQGRIALNPSVRFGIGGMVFLYVFQPVFVKVKDRMSPKVFQAVFWILATVFTADTVVLAVKSLF
jgi:uncharacterized membrane protein